MSIRESGRSWFVTEATHKGIGPDTGPPLHRLNARWGSVGPRPGPSFELSFSVFSNIICFTASQINFFGGVSFFFALFYLVAVDGCSKGLFRISSANPRHINGPAGKIYIQRIRVQITAQSAGGVRRSRPEDMVMC